MARDFRRQLDVAQNFAANAPVSFDLPRDSVYKEIVLDLQYRFTTNGTGAITTPFIDSPWTLIKRIELIADGKDTIKSYDGPTLHQINYFDYGVFPAANEIAIAANGDTGTQHAMLIIALESPGMEFPQHTWLDARKLSSLELRVNFGAGAADLAVTVPATVTINQFQLTPFGHEILDIDLGSTFSVNQEVMTQQAFPATAATQRRFRMNVGNFYRRVFLSTKDANGRLTSAEADASDRLTRIALIENGIFTRRNWGSGMLKQHNSLKFHPTGIGGGAENPNIPVITGAGAPVSGQNGGYRTGIWNMEIAEDGRENSLLNTAGYSDLSLELDWTGNNVTDLLRITPTIFLPAIR